MDTFQAAVYAKLTPALPCCFLTACLVLVSVDPSQTGRAVVLVSVTDVNDNPPGFATQHDAFVCEDAEAGQVRTTRLLHSNNMTFSVTFSSSS